MRDIERYQQAKALRQQGLTYAEVGKALGVSATRAMYMVQWLDRQAQAKAQGANTPSRDPTWWDGLRVSTAHALHKAGIQSKGDCGQLLDDLQVAAWRSAAAGLHLNGPALFVRSSSRQELNEVRLWLGGVAYVEPQKPVSPERLRAAMRLLEKHGYTVTPPKKD